ncbi:MAG TPA: M3 family metallopeptidase [Acidimicrobiia bacterium]|nr:M3 family metallopeptidase [Acidimicrobiia bacterium]
MASPAVGGEYRRTVLERGGSVDAGDLLRGFLGRKPNLEAFLRHLGIA